MTQKSPEKSENESALYSCREVMTDYDIGVDENYGLTPKEESLK